MSHEDIKPWQANQESVVDAIFKCKELIDNAEIVYPRFLVIRGTLLKEVSAGVFEVQHEP